MIPISSSITLLLYYRKKKKFDYEMNEIIKDEYINLEDNKMNELFTFGYLKDEDGNIIVDDTNYEDLEIEITTPIIETKYVDEFDESDIEFGEIDNI